MSNNARKIAGKVIDFLEKNRLPAIPHNYTVGYLYVTETHKSLIQEIDRLTDDGMRLAQADVDQLVEDFGLRSGGPVAADPSERIRHQLLRLADVSNGHSNATMRFGDEIQAIAADIKRVDELASNPVVNNAFEKMAEMTRSAVGDLQKSMAEIEALKQDLEAAKNDAKVDALTGLPNRRAIDERLAAIEASGKPVTIAFCDVDKFKSINDTFGHAVGDRVLKSLTEELRNTCGDHATVARWGGEEFVMVFETSDMAAVAQLVDQARKQMSTKALRVRETDEQIGAVTFSAGVASGAGDIMAITARADALLYKAKAAGRNRVVSDGAINHLSVAA